MKKILGICGDSFMASISKYDNNLENGHGKHFTDILKERLGCEIITYAKGGVSNQCIRLQIDEIIKHNPHHIIIGTTSPDRIEIHLNDLKVNNYFEKWKNHYFKSNNITGCLIDFSRVIYSKRAFDKVGVKEYEDLFFKEHWYCNSYNNIK